MTAFEGRIAQFNAPGQPFELREVRLDRVEAGEILVRIHRANVCGSDLHAWHGEFAMRGLGGEMPTVLGHEMVGSIAAHGSETVYDANGAPLDIGQRVVFPYFQPCTQCRNCLRGRHVSCLRLRMAMLGNATRPPYYVGGYGDYYLLPPGGVVYAVPDELPDELVAGVNCGLCQVIHGFDRVGLRFGETVAIQGAGGLGLYATAVAKASGASTVVVIDAVADRLDLASAFGADATICTEDVPSASGRAKLVREMTDGLGADVVAELAGVPEVVPEGLKMLAQGGRYLEIGNISLGRTYEADPSRLALGNKSIVGVCLYEPDVIGQALSFLARHQDRLSFDRLAETPFPLEHINEAFRAQEAREVVRAAIVPTMGT